jgi:CheY-like chemotaxis protein
MSETARTDLARIVTQGQRGAHLVRQILDFTRQSVRQPKRIDLVPFIKEAIKFLERTIPENVTISLEIKATELLVEADSVQLQQMLTNLVLNARDAMSDGGQLTLSLANFIPKPDQAAPIPELTSGRWGVCAITDNGNGIPADHLDRIFEPFFTTKGPERGSGLGLAQVYGIVQQHGGHIDVESRPGRGTKICVYLPLQEADSRYSPEIIVDKVITGQGELILLVEDEPEVLAIGRVMLEQLGYRVLTARNGQQAMVKYTDHVQEIDLVLTDLVMPVMDGLELRRALAERDPTLTVVLMSGYPLVEDGIEALSNPGASAWLPKPLILKQVSRIIGQALGNADRKKDPKGFQD